MLLMESFEAEVLGAKVPVLVDFTATWCPPCRALEPILHRLAADNAGSPWTGRSGATLAPMARRPAVRTSNARDSLEFLKTARPDLHLHLKKTLPAAVLERIETGVRTDWIPVEIDAQYVDAVLRYIGPEETRKIYQAFLVQSLVRSPMMSKLFHGVRRVFGVSVGAFLRVLPKGFEQSYQDAFDLRLERGEHEALLVFEDIAPEVMRAAYPVIWEGIFLGVYELAGAAPRLDYRIHRGTRRMEARFHW